MVKGRNHGIDFLRLVLMYMVCIMHTLGQGGVLDSFEKGTMGYNIFWLLEVICFCAVDGFAIISGYVASEKKPKYDKLINMWFQAFFYSFIITAIFFVVGVKPTWGLKDIIKSAFPVTFNKFWYFTSYFALFFAIPVINKFFFSIDKNTARKYLIVIAVLFSLMETLEGVFKTNGGFSVMWLIVLYCIGLLAKRAELFARQKTGVLIALWIACIIFTWGTLVLADAMLLISYVSPTILMSGLLMVIIFSRMPIKGKFVSKLSPLAFGIYLFQLNEVIWGTYIKNALTFVGAKNIMLGTVCVLAGASVIFVCGLLVEALRSYIAKKIHLPQLSSFAAKCINYVMCKLSILLN